MTFKNIKGIIILTLCAAIWGSAFVAQSSAMNDIEPFTFLFSRSVVGGVVLMIFIGMRGGIRKINKKSEVYDKKVLILGGVLCGIVIFLASAFQQFGIYFNDLQSTAESGAVVGKAGFITALYILFVPFADRIFFKKRVRLVVIFGMILALVGLYLLCMTGKVVPDFGDVLVFVCAILFTAHILIIDKFSPKTDGVKLSCIQFFVCSALSGAAMFIFENPSWESILAAAFPIIYAGAFSSGIAYTLQIVGQKYAQPTVASMVMSLESVFAVITAAAVLHQMPSASQIAGCVIMFAAIIISQLPEKIRA